MAFCSATEPRDGGIFRNGSLHVAWVGQWNNPSVVAQQLGEPCGKNVAETLAAAWQRWGTQALQRCDGILAGIVWDPKRRRLFAFRDKLGLVPLFFARTQTQVLVSTDSHWLCRLREERSEVNPRRLVAFMSRSSDCDTDDFVKGLHRIRPGEEVSWTAELAQTKSYYWQPDTSYDEADVDVSEKIVGRLTHILQRVSTQPHTVQLSGGVDSATLAGLLSKLGSPHSRAVIAAASMVAPDLPRCDESQAIDELEASLPLRVHRFPIGEHWPLNGRDVTTDSRWEEGPTPIAHMQCLIAFQRWTREFLGETTLINGHGGDDLFCCPRTLWERRMIHNRPGIGLHWLAKKKGLRTALRQGGIVVLEKNGLIEPVHRIRDVCGLNRPNGTSSHAIWTQPGRWIGDKEYFARNPSTYLSYQDWGCARLEVLRGWQWELACRASAQIARASNLRTVYPFLDAQLWEICLRIPPENLFLNGRQKGLLRSLLRGVLPDSVLSHRKFGGFDALIERGLGDREIHRVENLVAGGRLAAAGVIQPAAFRSAYRKYCQATNRTQNKWFVGSIDIWNTVAAEQWVSL